MLAVLRGLLDLLAPACCPGCDYPRPPGLDGFCDACAPLLEPLRSGPAAFAYGGPLADAIRRMKYARRSDLARPLGTLLVERAQPLLGRFDAVVPLPLHPKRRRQRGFDQAALLAHPVARSLGLPMPRRWLTRRRDTRAQAGLDAAGRRDNLRQAFVASPHVAGQKLIVVDDVRTTGATFAAAAEALLAQGALEARPLFLAAVVRSVDALSGDLSSIELPAGSVGIAADEGSGGPAQCE